MTDPLGINTDETSTAPVPGSQDKRLSRPSTEINPLAAVMKRRASNELCVGSPLKKAQLNYKYVGHIQFISTCTLVGVF